MPEPLPRHMAAGSPEFPCTNYCDSLEAMQACTVGYTMPLMSWQSWACESHLRQLPHMPHSTTLSILKWGAAQASMPHNLVHPLFQTIWCVAHRAALGAAGAAAAQAVTAAAAGGVAARAVPVLPCVAHARMGAAGRQARPLLTAVTVLLCEPAGCFSLKSDACVFIIM